MLGDPAYVVHEVIYSTEMFAPVPEATVVFKRIADGELVSEYLRGWNEMHALGKQLEAEAKK